MQPPSKQPASPRDPAWLPGPVVGLLWPTGHAWAPNAIFHIGAGCSIDKHLGTAGAVGGS